MAQVRVDWAPFAHGLNALMPPLDALKDPQVHFWLKLAQPTLSMLLSMPSLLDLVIGLFRKCNGSLVFMG
jgi:hypothetical protein